MKGETSKFLLTQNFRAGGEDRSFVQKIEVSEIEKRDRYLKYEEDMEGHRLDVVLRIGGDFIKIQRVGIISMKFTFVEDEMTDTFYESAAGRHHFTLYTKTLLVEDDRIVIEYDLYEQGQLLGNYHYKLEREGY